MEIPEKEKILAQSRSHVGMTILHLKKAKLDTQVALTRSKEIFKTLSAGDQIVENRLIRYNKKRITEIDHLKGSPYFVRCDVVWESARPARENKTKSLYFGKFGFGDEEIYSWITPASAMRYEDPGKVQYVRPDGQLQKATLVRKDQYMIVGGEVKFLATESIENSRELIYQEYFSKRKTGFVLPEIVAQMEKAQDQVIRAHHVGPFLISGPAGSGKTTLALHRVAYLVQSPDLANTYTSDSIIVFVQDNGTKEYFSHLLPELGIDDVLITTFPAWALSVLDLDATYVVRFGEKESQKDLYEFAKIAALKAKISVEYKKKDAFQILEKLYEPFFDSVEKKLFQSQAKEKVLDRIDLTLLLMLYAQTHEGIGTVKDYWVELKNGTMKKKRGFVPFEYSLSVVDEFQNYLPEQLRIIKSCLSKKSRSALYVGDMAQQVQLGTIKNWNEIDERIEEDRKVVLHKVYRNTKNILKYIQSLGYSIEIPEAIKEGEEVAEHIFSDQAAEIQHIQRSIKNNDFVSVGILAKDGVYLDAFRKTFSQNAKVHVMTMNEAQGVEFDIVFVVGIDRDTFAISFDNKVSQQLIAEKEAINKDLLYVALTRAISELQVLGRVKLGKTIQ